MIDNVYHGKLQKNILRACCKGKSRYIYEFWNKGFKSHRDIT